MRIKVNKYGKTKPCPGCGQELKFSWLSGMSSPHVFLYSSDSSEILVSNTLLNLYVESGENESSFENILNNYLLTHDLEDKGFGIKNTLKCNHCKAGLSNNKDFTVASNLKDKAVYLDGMVFRTDTDVFQVKFLSR